MYDEDGYAAVKRVVERGEDVATVKPMATIVVNYPVGVLSYSTKIIIIFIVPIKLYIYILVSIRQKLLSTYCIF